MNSEEQQQQELLNAGGGSSESLENSNINAFDEDTPATAAEGMLMSIIQEIFYSPMNLCLFAIILFLIYKIVRDRTEVPAIGLENTGEQELPKLRRDFTVRELRDYDGTQPDGRVLVAVNGSVYDVTKGKRFYGPGGPYATFAGRDASRNLATFNVAPIENVEYDDLSDLTPMEMESVIEWELQFKEKYDLVGKLLRENERPTNYDDDEEEEGDDEDTTSNGRTVDSSESDQNVNATATATAVGADGLRKRDVAAAAASKVTEAVETLTSTAAANATLRINEAESKTKSSVEEVNSTEC